MKYRAEIDGLRAVAVGVVILYHAGFELFQGGFVGVDVFFVISGYLITRIIHDELGEGRFSLANFYERRARRILPALFVMMAACAPAAWLIMLPAERESLSEAAVATVLFSSNILFWIRSSYFDTAAEFNPLLHTWSLAVEEQFYIVFPLIMMALARARASTRTLVVIVSVLCLASLVAAEWASRVYPDAAFYLIPFRAWELGAGSLIALTLGGGRFGPRWFREIAGLAGLGLILASSVFYDAGTPFPGLYATVPILGSVLIIACASERTLAGRLLSLKPMVWLGLISYSAYLWHQPLFAFTRLTRYHELDLVTIWVLIAASIALAWLSWRYVETPFRNRKRFTLPRMTAVLAPAAALLFAGGLVGNYTKGFANQQDASLTVETLFYELHVDRLDRIGSGTCHYNTRGENKTIEAFVENWACEPPEGERQGKTIAIFGDSIAADMAAALRANGVDTLQMTGAGCSLTARLQSPECRALAAAFRERLADGGVDEVWLANLFDPLELRPAVFTSMVEQWAETGVETRIWSPLPEYGDVRRALLAKLEVGDWPEDLYRDEASKAFFGVVEAVELPENVSVADSHSAFCEAMGDCRFAEGTELLVLDRYTHLTALGAARYGAVIASSIGAPEAPAP